MRKLLALFLILPLPSLGAMDFDGSTGYGESSTVDASGAAPVTMCCWINSDSATLNQTTFSLSRSSTSTERIRQVAAGAVASDPIRQETANAGSSNAVDSSTGYTAGTWHSACTVNAATNSRSAYIDGGSKITDTNTNTPVSIDRQNIGVTWTGASAARGGFFDGKLAECGIWNVALTDAEVATIAKGFAPPCVRRGSLASYYPQIRETTVLSDSVGSSNPLTLAGTTAVADHPRVINCQ